MTSGTRKDTKTLAYHGQGREILPYLLRGQTVFRRGFLSCSQEYGKDVSSVFATGPAFHEVGCEFVDDLLHNTLRLDCLKRELGDERHGTEGYGSNQTGRGEASINVVVPRRKDVFRFDTLAELEIKTETDAANDVERTRGDKVDDVHSRGTLVGQDVVGQATLQLCRIAVSVKEKGE
jgi:hypothetical protein